MASPSRSDIVSLPGEITPVPGDGMVGGIAIIDGEPVEIIDAHRLFASVVAAPARRPLCLLHADSDGWMTAFLKPTLESAGYRCVTRLPDGEATALVLAMDDAPPAGNLPMIRLRRDPDGKPGDIYRYDRQTLLTALAERIAGARR